MKAAQIIDISSEVLAKTDPYMPELAPNFR
jgi:hypothetical protein